jgi:predicted dehydrogenase
MMCHSVEVARYLLTPPGASRGVLRLVSASATTATLKWTRPRYAADLRKRMGVDFAHRPVEDFARGILTLEDADGHVGAGLRIQLELLGPEYSMEFSSLSTGLKVFLSQTASGAEGEDLVEKQNSEQGLMPVVEDEAGIYGYTDENRHMVEAFRQGVSPMETFSDGVGVVEMLMGLYRAAELGRTVTFPDPELEHYIPQVARS